MGCALMARVNGDFNQIAFDIDGVQRIMNVESAQLTFSHDQNALLLEVDDRVCRVEGKADARALGDYFIVLDSWKAFNVKEYKILFNVEELPDHRLLGTDEFGKRHLCRRYSPKGNGGSNGAEPSGSPRCETLNQQDVLELERMIEKLRQGQFYEALASEFSGRLKEIARELIEFRRDLQSKIEPGIVTLAEKEIPEASIQLEAINDTLESSTMKIMDIHEAQMELASGCIERLKALMGRGQGEVSPRQATEAVRESLQALEQVRVLNLRMTEPLSFQDLVGQRIQKIIRLVKSMEAQVEDLVISFGIKLKKYREDPTRSFEDLTLEVEEYKSELRGPQRKGEGLGQAEIDALLASL